MISTLNMIDRLQKHTPRKRLWFKVLNVHKMQNNIKKIIDKILIGRIKLFVRLQNNKQRLEDYKQVAVKMRLIDVIKCINYQSSKWLIVK